MYKPTDIDNLIKDIFLKLDKRQKEILEKRFRLKGNGKVTLASIGKKYRITRERVRQIENQSLKKIQTAFRNQLSPFISLAAEKLNLAGGVQKDNLFIANLRQTFGSSPNLEAKLRFLLLTADTPIFFKENDLYHSFWYSDDKLKQEAFRFIKSISSFFRKKGVSQKTNSFLRGDAKHENSLKVAKEIGFNSFNEVGLAEWPEITPKTVRDKIYLVLKNEKKPLHFSQITGLINQRGFDGKNAHLQTVHNELIKDSRFILVGRGLYGLAEHGFEAGTTEEIVRKTIKKEGPLDSRQIIELVSRQKLVKPNTITLSLQNKTLFRKLTDGRYALIRRS